MVAGALSEPRTDLDPGRPCAGHGRRRPLQRRRMVHAADGEDRASRHGGRYRCENAGACEHAPGARPDNQLRLSAWRCLWSCRIRAAAGRLRVHGKFISWRARPRTPGAHRRRGAETRRTFRDRQLASAAAGKNHRAGPAPRPEVRVAAFAGTDRQSRRSRRAQEHGDRRHSALPLRRDFRKTCRESVRTKTVHPTRRACRQAGFPRQFAHFPSTAYAPGALPCPANLV